MESRTVALHVSMSACPAGAKDVFRSCQTPSTLEIVGRVHFHHLVACYVYSSSTGGVISMVSVILSSETLAEDICHFQTLDVAVGPGAADPRKKRVVTASRCRLEGMYGFYVRF